MKNENKVKQGKKNKRDGAKFELLVRHDLESKGWIVSKWQNNVSEVFQQDIGEYNRKLEPAKRKYNPFTKRPMAEGTGFPDFICFKRVIEIDGTNFSNKVRRDLIITGNCEISMETKEVKELYKKIKENLIIKPYEVIGVEAKSNGYLDKEEREKCKWLLKNKIFSKILIVRKPKTAEELMTGEKVIYEEFNDIGIIISKLNNQLNKKEYINI